jgi:hypothetical protein
VVQAEEIDDKSAVLEIGQSRAASARLSFVGQICSTTGAVRLVICWNQPDNTSQIAISAAGILRMLIVISASVRIPAARPGRWQQATNGGHRGLPSAA